MLYFKLQIKSLQGQNMGPKQSNSFQQKKEQFFSNYQIIQQIRSQNIKFLEHKQTKKQFLFRQLSYNDKKQFHKAIQLIKQKKERLKGADHVACLQDFFQNEQDQYCSTFYKLYVLFQYPQRTLDDEINQRNLRKNMFTQTQLWSILASCILGLSHLQKNGIKHGSLKSSMIFLSQEGHIKISDPFTTGCQTNYETLLNKRNTLHIYLSPQQCQALQNQTISLSVNTYKCDIFTLGMIILECGLLQYQEDCYRDQNSRIHWEMLEYKKNRFKRNYSQELANMLEYMLNPDFTSRPQWIDLQSYVIKDSMGKSFISQARKSVIIGNSKPRSVNINRNFNEQFVPPQSQNNQMSNFYKQQNKSSAVNNNFKPNSVSHTKPQSSTLQNIQGFSPYQSGSQVNMRTSHNYIEGSPYNKQNNFDIKVVNVSDISNTRPLRSIFPNPYYSNKTKVDQNLIQVRCQDNYGETSRSVSDAGSKKTDNQYENSKNRYAFNNIQQPNHQRTQDKHSGYSPQSSKYKQNIFLKKNQPSENQGEFVIQTFKLGSRYQGYKRNGLRNGLCKFFYQDGGMYDGNWVNNKMEGFGKLFYQSGKIAYQGDWVCDQFTGKGILYNQKPDPLTGPYDYRNFDDIDQLWTKYEGDFDQDLKHGLGTLYLSNGQYFEGHFVEDAAQGSGVYTTAKSQKIRGIWENNIMVKNN